MSRTSRAQPATAEDFDEDADTELSGTKVSASVGRQAMVRQDSSYRMPSQSSVNRTRSTTSAMPSEGILRSMTQPVVQVSRSSSRSRATTVSDTPLQRSSSSSRRSQPTLHQPSRSTDQRYTLPHRPTVAPIQPPQGTAVPRPRSNSSTARPVSWAGAPYPAFEAPPRRGPPPSPSAYYAPVNAIPQFVPPSWPDAVPAPPPTYNQRASMYGAPPNWALPQQMDIPTYGVQPVAPSAHPFAPVFAAAPVAALPSRPQVSTFDWGSSASTASSQAASSTAPRPIARELYNARVVNTTRMSAIPPAGQPLLRRSSGRNVELHTRHIPGSFPDEDAIDYSESDSDGGYYEEDSRNFAISYGAARDSRIMPPPPRPVRQITGESLARTSSTSNVLNTNPRSFTYSDSDRSGSLRRNSSTRSSRSRQPSVSTAGTNRTPATTISSESHGPYVIVEDSKGRWKRYISNEEYEDLKRFQAKQQMRSQQKVSDAEAYQNAVRGGPSDELTAENIRQMIDQIPAAPKSRLSNRSRKSGQSATPSEGFKLMFGETTLQMIGNARFEVHHDDDSGPRLVINPGNNNSNREKSYYTETSKSSESRLGRSRGGSDRDSRGEQRSGKAPAR